MRSTLALLVVGVMVAACSAPRDPVTPHPADAVPGRLSAWNLVFADGNSFELNDGVVPYDLNTPLFSDYALKMRTVWMPDGDAAIYDEDGTLDFPVGTIISKTFHYQKADGWSRDSFRVIRADRESNLDENGQLDLDEIVLVETRLLVHYDKGWQAFPYVWNDAQTEATLEIAGDYREMVLVSDDGTENFPYIVPDANQCGGCHVPNLTTKTMSPLGPKAWQLNRPYEWWGGDASQLDHWSANGLLRGLSADPPAGARWSDPDGDALERRAKAYLDVNCAHCHNESGPADTSALHLGIDAPINAHYGVCKTPVAVGRGSGGRTYDLFPGRPDESIMIFRMEHSDPAIAMPELGRGVVHTEGVQLVRSWISQMNGEC